jgi:hypothetical protein
MLIVDCSKDSKENVDLLLSRLMNFGEGSAKELFRFLFGRRLYSDS